MKLKICFIIILALASSQLYAQKEANNWFFGSNIGWSWNTTRSYPATGVFGTTTNTTLYGLPSLVSGSLMSTGEGCFSVSDEDGNLLFFSDGMTIWNKEKAIMQNGQNLTGHSSSAQSRIIIP